ncbi:MAG: hypothetical protein JWQ01_1143 [Massilia sp.]|nr:hypothetical protein [Massilia sp.]
MQGPGQNLFRLSEWIAEHPIMAGRNRMPPRGAATAILCPSSTPLGCAKIISVKILVKSLIVWFLLLAVPFQGFASATMLFCAPMQSHSPVAHTDAASSEHHDHDAMLAGQHADHDHNISGDHEASPDDADHTSMASHHDGSKCNSCAACCFGASMPPSGSVRPAIDSQRFSAIPFDTGFVPAVELALPERPPQASLI